MKDCKYNLSHTWIIRNVATALIGDLATVDGWTTGHVGIADLDLAKGFRPGGVFFWWGRALKLAPRVARHSWPRAPKQFRVGRRAPHESSRCGYRVPIG
jgi:hypothetical protein